MLGGSELYKPQSRVRRTPTGVSQLKGLYVKYVSKTTESTTQTFKNAPAASKRDERENLQDTGQPVSREGAVHVYADFGRPD